jgi:membrane-associated phospholipid phosphatase
MRGFLAAVLSACACVSAPAADDSIPRTLVHNVMEDQKQIWTSPVRITREHPGRVIAFTLITAALIAVDRRASNGFPNTLDQIGTSGAVSQIGAAYTTVGVAGGFLLIGKLVHNDRAEETGLLGSEALLDTLVVGEALKFATNRERPYQENGKSSFWEGGSSFPSGHAISSWSLAEVIASEYHDEPLVRIGAYTLATAVSLSRVSARKHFFSDVFVGGTLGYLIGRYVYRSHHDPARKWSLAPGAHVDPLTRTYGASLVWSSR